jgi:hypothetical protein
LIDRKGVKNRGKSVTKHFNLRSDLLSLTGADQVMARKSMRGATQTGSKYAKVLR